MIVARDLAGKTWWLLRFQRRGEVLATKCGEQQAISLPAHYFTAKDRQRLRESQKEAKHGKSAR